MCLRDGYVVVGDGGGCIVTLSGLSMCIYTYISFTRFTTGAKP